MEYIQKHSKKRDAILECIRQTRTHPAAEWVYNQLKPRIPNLSLATVYRNLALFKAQGVIQSVGVVDGLERFDGNTEPHVHFICIDCGSILDLPELNLPQALCLEAAEYTGGAVTECRLSFRGRCRSCLQNCQ